AGAWTAGLAGRFLGGLLGGRLLGRRFLGGGFLRGRLGGRLGARRGLGRRLGRGPAGLAGARLELEADLAVRLAHQESLELAMGAAGHEAVEQVGAAVRQQLVHLLARDLLLQDDLARPEIAGLVRAYRLFA